MSDRPHLYILEGTTPVPVDCVLVWAKWLETADRRVALTLISPALEVSTVFLSLDYNFMGDGPPVLFETKVFEVEHSHSALDQFTRRWTTWHNAEQGHEAVCAHILAWLIEESPNA